MRPALADDRRLSTRRERGALRRRLAMREKIARRCRPLPAKRAVAETDRATYQAMEALIHNLNTMHSRAGAQMPFSSINYGMDTSPEGRMVIKNVLLAHGGGPWQRRDAHLPHPDLPRQGGRQLQPRRARTTTCFKLACACQRQAAVPQLLLPGRALQPAILQGGPPRDRDRLHGLPHPRDGQRLRPQTGRSANGRGNLSFTSINLPRIAIKAKGNVDCFFEELDRKIDLVVEQLLERFEIQRAKKVRQLPLPHGAGRVAGLAKSWDLGRRGAARCSSTARCPSALSAWPKR